MFGLEDQFFGQITVDGNELPIQPIGGFDEITIHENVMTQVPTCKMVIYDTLGVMGNQFSFQDGTPFTILIGRSTNDQTQMQTANFRCFGAAKTKPIGSRNAYTISGVLDCAKYWRGTASDYNTGTSAQSITKIAQACGLTADTVPTNDSMNWIMTRKSNANIAAYIAEHGYVDNKSIMCIGLDCNKVLRYRNLAQVVKQSPVYIFGDDGTGNDSRILFIDIKSGSGLQNNLFAYGMRATQEKMDGTASSFTQTNITLQSNNLSINSVVKNQVGSVRNEWMPMDMGNTHDNFQSSAYQNLRGMATFVLSVEPVVGLVTGLNLFDPVTINIASSDQTGSLSQNYNGPAFIAAKTRTIRGSQYYEKFSLKCQGPAINSTGVLIN
jgi:hypothetical protein